MMHSKLLATSFLLSSLLLISPSNADPYWSQNITNSTTLGTPVLFSVNWTDNALNNSGGYVFSFDNGTGTFVNDSFVYWGEVPHNSTDWRNGLVGLWHMNEGLGGELVDFSGNGNNGAQGNGTAGSEPTWTTNSSCRFDDCLEFDGANNHVLVNDSSSLQLTSALTLSVWIYPRLASGWGLLVGKPNGPAHVDPYYDYAIFQNGFANDTVQLRIESSSINIGAGSLKRNSWNHVVGTWDRGSESGKMTVYVNGVEVGSTTKATNITESSQDIRIGLAINNVSDPFRGMIDEVAIWNRKLSAEDVQKLYNLSSRFPGQSWTNVTKNVNSTEDSTIRWQVYASDDAGNTNTTPVFGFNFPLPPSNITTTMVPNPAWWNETVSLFGSGSSGLPVTVKLDGTTKCVTIANSSDQWECNLTSPLAVGRYEVSVNIGSSTELHTLRVVPSYGSKPTGTTPRFVVDFPFAVMEPSGRISDLIGRFTISRGYPG